MTIHPALISAGGPVFVSPDGKIPPEFWAEYAALVLLEPVPEQLGAWVRHLEDGLGVTDDHRRTLARRAENRAIRPWTILRVTSGMERKVAAALGPRTRENPHGAGLTVYVPLEKFRPANHWRPRTRPLIPGYIFADLQCDDDLDTARANHAVRDVMCQNGSPVKVSPLDIGSLILFEACRAFDRTLRASGSRARNRRGNRAKAVPSRWKQGQRVKIDAGAFSGYVGTIMNAGRDDRLEVLISIFGREAPVILDETLLEGWDAE